MVQDRWDDLCARFAEHDLEWLIVSLPANTRYLTGFTGEGLVLVSPERPPVIVTDSRFELQAREETPEAEVLVAKDGYLGAVAESIGADEEGCIGFEADHFTYARFEDLAKKLDGREPKPTRRLVEALREIKDEEEQEKLRASAALNDRVFARLLEQLAPGRDEKGLAWEIEGLARQLGAEKTSFPPIVASGPRSAHPHAEPTDRKLQEGDQVKIDLGVQLDGYCSDMTRTVFLGEPTDKQREVYSVCLRAQQAALDAAAPEMKAADLDGVARQIIEEAGYGEQFGHGLGHGVGLNVHEAPRVGKKSEDVLRPGMAITIEPGIYIEGWGGVRIEDLVLIIEDGIEVLSQAPKVEL